MRSVPIELEDALYAATAEVVPGLPLQPSKLARWVVDRSRRYTSDRETELADGGGAALAHDPSDADLAARAVFFTVADAMKIAIPLGELANAGALPAHRPLLGGDLGAGCGAMSLGLVASLPGVPVAITAIDRDARALAIATRALGRLGVKLETRTADVATAAIPACDLVIAGTLLNELPEPARAPLVERALAALAPDGAAIFIEPALRDTSRALHALRDAFVARVFAPCTRKIAPCPALADERDWCHEDRPLALPPRTAQLSRATGLRDGGMRFSYLVLRRADGPALAPADTWRLVSAPHVQKGKHEIFGCSNAGRVTLRLLKRHRTAHTKAFEAAHRGDLVATDAAPDDARVEITATSTVAVRDPSAT